MILVKIIEKTDNYESELYLHPRKDSYGNIYDYDVFNSKYFWTEDFDEIDGLIDLCKLETLEEWQLQAEEMVYDDYNKILNDLDKLGFEKKILKKISKKLGKKELKLFKAIF